MFFIERHPFLLKKPKEPEHMPCVRAPLVAQSCCAHMASIWFGVTCDHRMRRCAGSDVANRVPFGNSSYGISSWGTEQSVARDALLDRDG